MSDARAVPFYCPFCGDEDLFPTTTPARRRGGPEDVRPHEGGHGTWHCRACTRVFGLRLVGLHARPAPASSSGPGGTSG